MGHFGADFLTGKGNHNERKTGSERVEDESENTSIGSVGGRGSNNPSSDCTSIEGPSDIEVANGFTGGDEAFSVCNLLPLVVAAAHGKDEDANDHRHTEAIA